MKLLVAPLLSALVVGSLLVRANISVPVEQSSDPADRIPTPAFCKAQYSSACQQWAPLKRQNVDWELFTFSEDDRELEPTCQRWRDSCVALSTRAEYAFFYGCEQEGKGKVIRAFCTGFRAPSTGRKPRSHTGTIGFTSGTIQLVPSDGKCQTIEEGFCQTPFAPDRDLP